MKICLINNLYKPYARGGAEKVVEMTVRGLREKGHDIFVITAAPRLMDGVILSDSEGSHNGCEVSRFARNDSSKLTEGGACKIYRIWSPNLIFYGNLGQLSAPLRIIWHFLDVFNFITAWKVRKIIKTEKPDAIFLHNLKGLGYLIPKFLRSENLVLIPHDVQLAVPSGVILDPKISSFISNSREWVNRGYQRINQFLFDDIKKIISPSKWLLDFYTSRGFLKDAKKMVLHNPAPPLLAAETRNPKSETLNFLFVGQLEESKGVIFLIKSLKGFKFHVSSFKLIIIGDGSERVEVEKLIAKDERFSYLGKLEGEEVQKAYQEADYTIVPSLAHENCPTVILESFAVGTPVIASRIGGIPELVEHGQNGFLFNVDDALDLIELLKKIPNVDWQKLTEAARTSAKNHNLDKYINLLLSFSYKEEEQDALERESCQMCQQRMSEDDY